MLIPEQKQAAEALGVSSRTLRDWAHEPGFPDCASGYDVVAIKAWRDKHARKGAELSDQLDRLNTALKGSKLQREQLAIEKARLALDVAKRRLIPLEELQSLLGDLAAALRQCGEQLARQCGPAAAQILEDALAELQREIESRLPDEAAGEAGRTPRA
jgi:hypothetical protein